jgi:hypothetical protein
MESYKITENEINELKNIKKPSKPIRDVMEAVSILLTGEADWENSKKILAESNILVRIQLYNKFKLDHHILKKLRPLVEKESFNVENVSINNRACGSFAKWVIDIYKYGLNVHCHRQMRRLSQM